MTLTGILKNILLVVVSVMIWHTNISGLQFLGYAIALAGLVYYSIGWDQLTTLAQSVWVYARGGYEAVRGSPSAGGEENQGRLPAAVRRALIMGLAAVVILVLAGGIFYGAGGNASVIEVGTTS
jgi:hypothetical protein